MKTFDLVLLEQEGDALDVAVDALVLEFHHRGKIERRLADLDAHVRERVTGLVVKLRGMQQRLRRNAADIETAAPEGLVLLHHRDLHPELRRADGADIAAGAGTNNDEVVGRVRHELYPSVDPIGADTARSIAPKQAIQGASWR